MLHNLLQYNQGGGSSSGNQGGIEDLTDVMEKTVNVKHTQGLIPVKTMQDINERHDWLMSEVYVPKRYNLSKNPQKQSSTQDKKTRRKEMIRQYKLRKSQPSQSEQPGGCKDEDIQDSRVMEVPRPCINATIEKKALINNSYITRVTSKPSYKGKMIPTTTHLLSMTTHGLGQGSQQQ